MTNDRSTQEPAPRLPCDIVMKGGITSGVVYPPAIALLSDAYTFRNIGGTSAGAIAAAAAAAAEYGRQHGRSALVPAGRFAFDGLRELSSWLGEEGNLAGLFQARGATGPLLAVAKAGLQPGVLWRRATRALRAAVLQPTLSWRGIVVAIVFAAVAALIVWGSSGWNTPAKAMVALILGGVAALILGVVAFVVALAYGLVAAVCRLVPAEGYGLCSGMPSAGSTQLALSSWLTERINELAGVPAGAPPLTFGHLWYGPERGPAKRDPAATMGPGDSDPAATDASERAINLEMLTTNLTHGRPYHLPFIERTFFFDEDEMRTLFPENVVEWMTHHARGSDEGAVRRPTVERDGRTIELYPFPVARDLPVVVATRMSLSFPVLLSAVRLYAFRYERGSAAGIIEACWFSDGGITSNFPIHFFDALLPRWPTFGIDLRPHAVAAADVELARDNSDEPAERWHRFDAKGPDLVGFFGAIVDTMMNWRDNAQMRLPGYRDRVAHVSLTSDEGGLNLGMPSGTIKCLAKRGAGAASALLAKFYAPPGARPADGWRMHRWVRYRVAMAALEDVQAGIGRSVTERVSAEDEPYFEMPASRVGSSPDGYPLANRGQTARAAVFAGALRSLYAPDAKAQASLTVNAPAARPRLRLTSRVAG